MNTKAVVALVLPWVLLAQAESNNSTELGSISIEGSASEQNVDDRTYFKTSELAKKAAGGTLGDFLKDETFIDSASYGPAVGRPVVKGMDGYRVGITQGNTVLNDLSALSQDHAVGLMPRSSKGIELIKGSASLLYGSYSGGVIKVEGEEHEYTLLKPGVRVELDGAIGSNGAGQSAGGTFEASDSNLSLYFDSYYHQADDYRAGGGAVINESDTLSVQNHLVLGWQINSTHLVKLFGDWMLKDYGIPNSSPEATRINMQQYRYGATWHMADVGVFEHIHTEVQSSHYLHNETEDGRKDGLFGQDQQSASTLLEYSTQEWFHETHLQYLQSALQVCHEHGKCDEFFDAVRTPVEDGASLTDYYNQTGIPFSHGHPMPNTAEKSAVIAHNAVRYFDEDELGIGARVEARYMNVDQRNIQEPWLVTDSVYPGYYHNKKEAAFSTTANYIHRFSEEGSAKATVGYIERLPAASELYWNGFHHATESYILGDPQLKNERSINVDLEAISRYGHWQSAVSGYYYHFLNYIYQAPLAQSDGTIRLDPFHGTPVWKIRGEGARVYGISLQQRYTRKVKKQQYNVNAGIEMIRGELFAGGNIPRMPPFSAFVELEHKYGGYSSNIKYKRVDKARFLAENETPTDGYGWLSAMLAYEKKRKSVAYSLYAKAENITDELARNHLSFLKESAPLPGRQFSVGAEVKF